MSKFSIELKSGLSYSNPFISKFNSDFDTIEFIVENSDEFAECTFSVVYNVLGNCGMDVENGGKLARNIDNENVSLLWTLDESISCESGIVLYQVVAYKSDDNGRTVAVWYSPQGRIVVGDSIDTTEYETLQIGSQPSLVANLLTIISDVKNDVEDVDAQVNDASASIVSLEREVADITDSILNINSDIQNTSDKTDALQKEFEEKDNEMTIVLSDIRQNAENMQKEIDETSQLLDTKVDKLPGKQLSTEDYTTDDKQLLYNLDEEIDGKVDKISGKQLSTEDYTSEDKQLLYNLDEEIDGKVDKISGKQLSTEDYTCEDKQMLYSLNDEIKQKPGEVYEDKGEIFTDYANNKAKSKYSHVSGRGTVSGQDITYEINDIAFNGYDPKRLIVNDSTSLANIRIGDVISGEFTYDIDLGGYIESGGTKKFSATVVGIDYEEVLLNKAVASGDLNTWVVTSSSVTGTRYNIQNVEGMYNIEDSEARYLHITGNGENDNDRSNAYTLDKNGVAWFKGGIKVGGENQDEGCFIANSAFFKSSIPQIDITVEEQVKSIAISQLEENSLSDYNFTTMRVLVENAGLETTGTNSEITIRLNKNTYENETGCSINIPTTFINNSTKQYWGGYINLVENLYLGNSAAAGSEFWRAGIQMPVNTSTAMTYKRIETIYIQSALTVFPVGTKIKIWLK